MTKHLIDAFGRKLSRGCNDLERDVGFSNPNSGREIKRIDFKKERYRRQLENYQKIHSPIRTILKTKLYKLLRRI